MTEEKLNSYTGRWASKQGTLTVDAPNLETAIRTMNTVKGKDPMTVVRFQDDVYVANESSDYAHIQVLSKYMKGSHESGTPNFGQVYPKEMLLPLKDEAIITAVPNMGFHFVSYTNEDGMILTTENEFKFVVKGDITIYANFQKGSNPNIPYTFNESQFLVTDENYVSLRTTNEIIDDTDLIPTSQAVYKGLENKVDIGDEDYINTIDSITLNDRPVEVEEKVAKIDLTQDYLYEDKDIDFSNLF